MSIISDALKKAREERDEAGETVRSDPRHAAPAAHRGRSDGRWRLIVTLGAILIGTPLLLEVLSSPPSKGTEARTRAPGAPGRAQFAVEERPVFFGSQRPAFSLSGIAQFQDSYMAVVNGHILKQGDEVQGAKVLAIRADSVELDYRGERIVLEKTF